MDTEKYTITSWPQPKWRVLLNGNRGFQINVEHAPNRFHRVMQRLVLGIVWQKTNDD
jgi:hypothetical protein